MIYILVSVFSLIISLLIAYLYIKKTILDPLKNNNVEKISSNLFLKNVFENKDKKIQDLEFEISLLNEKNTELQYKVENNYKNENLSESKVKIEELILLTQENLARQINFSNDNDFMSTQLSMGLELIFESIEMFKNFSIQTKEASKEGNEMLDSVKMQISFLNESILNSREITEELTQKSQEIEKILNVIVDISSKINLLALNASIEAARAGEHGRGFSVVAEEVKKLAVKTQESSKQISNIVNVIQNISQESYNSINKSFNESVKSKEIVNEAEMIFDKIVSKANETSELASEVNDATLEIRESTSEFENINKEVKKYTEELNVKIKNAFEKL